MTTKKESKNQVLNYIGVFLLGILLAVNLFFAWSAFYLRKEIEKLKADDLTLAQAINTLSQQLNQLTGGQMTGPTISTDSGEESTGTAENNTTNETPEEGGAE